MGGKTDKNMQKSKLREGVIILSVLVAAIGILFGLLTLSQCKRDEPVHEGVALGESRPLDCILDTETNIRYAECKSNIGIEQVFESDGAYITLSVEGQEYGLYPIKSQPKEKFLALKKSGTFILYREESLPELSLNVFDPVSADIYMNGFKNPIDQFVFADSAKPEDVVGGVNKYIKLIKDALNGDAADDVPTSFAKDEYGIRLYSQSYAGIYYDTVFKTAADGRCFLYDRVYHRYYEAPEELVKRIIG